MNIIESINGKTKVFGIIGNPIEHSFSPVLQTTLFKENNIDAVYVPFRVENEELENAVLSSLSLNIQGLNVTVPHKISVMKYIKEIDETAKKIGAVNTLKKIEDGFKGFNTDILGLEKTLLLNQIEITEKTVVILGAGGAANSAAVLAAEKKAKEIYIVNRTIDNAKRIKKLIKNDFKGDIHTLDFENIMDIKNPQIVFQTTSVGMGENNKESPVKNIDFFKNTEAAIDIIYTPWETQFLKDARKMNCMAVNGFDMLIYQGIASFEIWNDLTINNEKALEFKNSFEDYYKGKNNA